MVDLIHNTVSAYQVNETNFKTSVKKERVRDAKKTRRALCEKCMPIKIHIHYLVFVVPAFTTHQNPPSILQGVIMGNSSKVEDANKKENFAS